MKNNSSRFPGSVRPVIYSITSALALMGAASQVHAQFAKTPLYLQNETQITEQPKVKHNIMFFVDNSGSMRRSAVDGSYNGSHKTRLQVTKDALNGILDKHGDKFNWGLQALVNKENDGKFQKNYTNAEETFNITPEQMRPLIEATVAEGYTPATRRYYEVVASTVMPNIKYRCQKSYVVMLSDGDANLSCNVSNQDQYFHYRFNYDNNNNSNNVNNRNNRYPISYFNYNQRSSYYPNAEDYRDEPYRKAYKYFGPSAMNGLNPNQLANVCAWHSQDQFWYSSYWDTANGYNGQTGGIEFFSRKLSTKDIKTSEDGKDAAGVSWDGNKSIDPPGVDYKNQNVQTFTVGFGNSISDEGKKFLVRAASQDDWYFNADKPEELQEAFDKIISLISNDSASPPFEGSGGTAPATSSSGLPDLAATIHLNTGSWSSQIRFNKLDVRGRNTGVYTQPSFGSRKTLINTGSDTYFIDSVPEGKLNNAYFGIEDGADKDQWKKLLEWTGRVGSNDTAYSPYRQRKAGERDLGDILDGSVAAVGNKVNNRREYMVAAANDGMVHIFQSAAGNNPYDLKVSYLPAGMEQENDASGNSITLAKSLKDIAHADYGKSIENHKYGVNGGFTLRQTAMATNDSPMPQRVFMFGAMGQGGRGAYALNLGGKKSKDAPTGLDADAWSSEIPLFETAKGENNKLGYTVGTPQIGRVSVKRPADKNTRVDVRENIRYAGFLASGYRVEDKTAAENETALYVYEMLGQEVGTGDKRGSNAGTVGAELAKIVVKDGIGGLSTPTLLDTDFDGVIDVAYAGDRGGNMYRFDLRSEMPSQWKAIKIFSGTTLKPITSAPAVSRRSTGEYVVIFGTGSEIYQNDLGNKDTQSIYGIYDNLKPDAPEITDADAATADNLQAQEFLNVENNGGYIYLSNNQVAQSQKGWKIDLREGERVSLKPTMILRTAIVTIRKYTSDGGKTIGKEEAEKDLCLPVSNNKATVTSTTFLGVNADNGGALNHRSARFTPDTVIRKLDGFGNQYANGLTREGIVNFTFINPSQLDDSPVSADGDSGGTGTDKELAVSPSTPNNKCFPGNSNDRSLLLNIGNESLEVNGRVCGLQRISWRELFTF